MKKTPFPLATVSRPTGEPIPPTRFSAVVQPSIAVSMAVHQPPPTRFGPTVSQAKSAHLPVSTGVVPPRPGAASKPVVFIKPPLVAQTQQGNRFTPPVDNRKGVVQPMNIERLMVGYGPWTTEPDERLHPPSDVGSDFGESEWEDVKDVRNEMVEFSKKTKAIKKRQKLKPQPRETVKGMYGERAAANYFRKKHIDFFDANVVLQKNVAGIDHIVNYGSFCFSQSKVFISAPTLKACAVEYTRAISARYSMAEDFLKFVFSEAFHFSNSTAYKSSNNQKIKKLKECSSKLGNKRLEYIIGLMEAVKDPQGEAFDESHPIVKAVGDSIIFPIPADIYVYLTKKFKDFAIALHRDSSSFDKLLHRSYFLEDVRRVSKAKQERVKDPDFEIGGKGKKKK
jgi:hypothetical protein